MKWGPTLSAGPTQRDDRHQNHPGSVVERVKPHTGHRAFDATTRREGEEQAVPMLQTGTQAIKETTLSSRQPKAVPASKTLRRCSAQPDTQGETQRGRPAEPRISTPAVHERRRQEGREGKERANPKGGEKNNETKRGGQRDSQTKIFFSSGMADHALRLGPYMRRSSLK